MYSKLGHASLVSLNRLDRLREANIPEADLSVQAAKRKSQLDAHLKSTLDSLSGNQLPVSSALHVHVGDP